MSPSDSRQPLLDEGAPDSVEPSNAADSVESGKPTTDAPPKRVLIVGHSHVLCLSDYLATTDHDHVKTIQLRTALNHEQEFVAHRTLHFELRSALAGPPPDSICLCMAGNLHNRVASVEHPRPFTVLFPGANPQKDKDRWLIPYQVMLQSFQQLLRGWLKMANAVYHLFPQARRFYFNPPPPLQDWSGIDELPEQLEEMLYLGHPPADLRLRLYQLQTDLLRRYAESRGAQFIDTPPSTLDAEGFLAREFFDNDPTHANSRYAEVLYAHIMKCIGSAP